MGNFLFPIIQLLLFIFIFSLGRSEQSIIHSNLFSNHGFVLLQFCLTLQNDIYRMTRKKNSFLETIPINNI